MKFMLILKGTKDSEAGKMPSEEVINAMVKYNQEQAKAGVLLSLRTERWHRYCAV